MQLQPPERKSNASIFLQSQFYFFRKSVIGSSRSIAYFKENDSTSKFVKHVSTETSVIFS